MTTKVSLVLVVRVLERRAHDFMLLDYFTLKSRRSCHIKKHRKITASFLIINHREIVFLDTSQHNAKYLICC